MRRAGHCERPLGQHVTSALTSDFDGLDAAHPN
jgi:hypothetical protein